MNVFDWLSDMDVPMSERFDVVEVKFKGGRKEYFRNTNQLSLHTGDFVVCEMPTGYHIGCVSLQGDLVRLQMLKKKIANDENIKSIYRIATPRDMEKHEQSIARELPTMYRSRIIAKETGLNMKLSDVEYQSDNTKATFYYSADERVDFRELIKGLASEFKVRIEMRQISLRQEAARLGGIGMCGRELCCSTWLADFKNITTSAARYQNLSLNPTKLSGQCGRLKCCLNYELETYIDALKDIPHVDAPLKTQKGDAYLQKTDIFKKVMWFAYQNDSSTWHPMGIEQVNQVLSFNERGEKPVSLEVLELEEAAAVPVGGINSDLAKMDKKYSNRDPKNRNSKKSNDTKPIQSNKPPQQSNKPLQQANKPSQLDNKPPQQTSKPSQPQAQEKTPSNPQQGGGNRKNKRRPNRGGNRPQGNKGPES